MRNFLRRSPKPKPPGTNAIVPYNPKHPNVTRSQKTPRTTSGSNGAKQGALSSASDVFGIGTSMYFLSSMFGGGGDGEEDGDTFFEGGPAQSGAFANLCSICSSSICSFLSMVMMIFLVFSFS